MENKNSSAINKHKIVTAEEWRKERIELLKEEKQLTRQSDAVAGKRQNLPWVKVDKEYMFETENGKVPFAELFKGRSQLLVYHFMLGPGYEAGCPHCSAIADGFNGIWLHLANHDVMLWAISRAPFAKLKTFKERMCWSFPWASSSGSDFNYDYNVSFSEEQQRTGDIEYNYTKGNLSSKENDVKETDDVPEFGKKIAAAAGTDWATFTKEAPGMGAFIMDDGIIYHTYSCYARGLDGLWNIYQWLDRAPLGRNESGLWMKHHDKYEDNPQKNSDSKNCCN
jgi:predicted dithiol-disulfide oxidoreductase (DUF899 family)